MPIISPRHREPRWFVQPRLTARHRPSPALKHWLLDAGSLTAKLVRRSGGKFNVQVLRQDYSRANLSEAKALGISFQQRCLVREVILLGDGKPWVFARSLLPLTSLTGSLRHLRRQGNRPLGAFLFSQPQLTRSAIALSHISRHHNYVPAALIGDCAVWGRRSIFSLNGKPLLVSEVFLPDFLDAPSQ